VGQKAIQGFELVQAIGEIPGLRRAAQAEAPPGMTSKLKIITHYSRPLEKDQEYLSLTVMPGEIEPIRRNVDQASFSTCANPFLFQGIINPSC
jgi:hypothetical protein